MHDQFQKFPTKKEAGYHDVFRGAGRQVERGGHVLHFIEYKTALLIVGEKKLCRYFSGRK
ncbi:hypothetical protein [Pseudomonas sp. D1-2]|uniref:hypothetical protein n=1 Tax=unclassified Pseudomonas TaxID=196821 RepID=UPI003DA97506